MPVAKGAAKARESEELVEADVPATVVCAHCGDADCPGCLNEITRSGVVAVVPWERPGTSSWTRLWATARATTLSSVGSPGVGLSPSEVVIARAAVSERSAAERTRATSPFAQRAT